MLFLHSHLHKFLTHFNSVVHRKLGNICSAFKVAYIENYIVKLAGYIPHFYKATLKIEYTECPALCPRGKFIFDANF